MGGILKKTISELFNAKEVLGRFSKVHAGKEPEWSSYYSSYLGTKSLFNSLK